MSFGAVAPRRRTRYTWLAAPLLAAALAGCGQATAPATAAPTAVAAAPAISAATPTPVVAASPAPAAKAAHADTDASKTPAASARTYRRAAPEPLAIAAPVAAPEPEPEAVVVPATVAVPVAHMQSGRVLDENGRPMVGATILLKGSRKGTSTDANGNYSLEVPKGDNTFLVGYGGYQDETTTAHEGQPLNVTLVPAPVSKGNGRRGRQ